ncbi:MAG: hypothetical protein FWC43_05015 [Planctomycetaceae bacterium]|nr:hypothetical protein [Planctomycetaceae bacterium]
MFFTQAPPQRASTSHENGFSYLSWKRKTLLAATVVLCGGGLAAQFPNTITEAPAAVSLDSAQTDGVNVIPLLSQPQNRYAHYFQTSEEDEPVFAESGEPIGRYIEPPAMSPEDDSEDLSSAPQTLTARKIRAFEQIDDSGFERTALNLPLAKWNSLFDKSPPLNERTPQPQIDDNAIVPAQPETLQTMKPETQPLIRPRIDLTQLVPVSEIVPRISEDQIRPAE